MSDKNQDDNIPDTDLEADENNEFSDLSMEESEEDDAAFYDGDDDLGADEEFIEEDWEAYDDEFVEEEPAAPKKKKSKSDKLVIGGAAVAGLLVMLFVMGGGEAPPPQQTAAPQAANMAASQAGGDAAGDSKRTQRDLLYNRNAAERQQTEVKGGFLNNPDDLAAMDKKAEKAFKDAGYYYEEEQPADESRAQQEENAKADDLLPMPTPIQQEEATQSPEPPALFDEEQANVAAADETTEGQLLFNMDEEPASEQTGELIQKSPDKSRASVADRQQQKSLSIAEQEMLATLNDKLDNIVTRIEEMENSFSALEKKVASVQIQANETDGLARSLKKLERKIDDVSSNMKAQSGQETKARSVSVAKKAAPPPVPVKKSPAPEQEAGKIEDGWVLKAVQPGKAWISRPGSNEMKTVKIGDMLAGIGKITAIDLVEGRWVVQGTSSKITQ